MLKGAGRASGIYLDELKHQRSKGGVVPAVMALSTASLGLTEFEQRLAI